MLKSSIKISSILIIIIVLLLLYVTNTSTEKPFFDNAVFLKDQKLIMKSPLGETPNALKSLILKARSIPKQTVSNKRLRVIICMHDLKNDWSSTLLDGLTKTLKYYNIDVLAITDGEFKVKKQILDIENAIKLKPDVILTLPLDTEKLNNAYRKVLDNNIKLVFFDTIPKGFKPKNDYIGLVIGDSYQLGVLSANSLAKMLDYSGNIALVTWKNKMYTVDQRTEGAKNEFSKHDNIHMVKELKFTEFYEIEPLIEELLKKHPELDGVWTVWDTPAFEVIKVLEKHKSKVKVATVDMSKEVAKNIKSDKNLKTTAVDNPYMAGIAGGLLVVLDSVGETPESYIVTPADIVTKGDLEQKWEKLYHSKLK